LASHKDPVAVIGLGRFGTALALELARGGTEVLAVDNRPDVVQRLSGQLGQVVIADSTDPDALNEIGIGDFGRVVVAIGNDLEASILTTALLAELEIRDIWAKAISRQQATILERIGAHHVVFPEQDMGERIAHLVAGRLLDWVGIEPEWVVGRLLDRFTPNPEWVFAKTKPPRELVGVPLGESGLRKKHRVTVVSVKPEHQVSYTHADYDTVLTYGSVIVIAGRPDDVERFVDLQ
jgi:trk system potassium uptake protein